jgi:hypothetical protein
MQEEQLLSEDRVEIPLPEQAWDVPLTSRVVEVHESVIVYEHTGPAGKEVFRSDVILKDKATLLFLLAEQRETSIYVDAANRSNYYFDLEFLESE